MISLLQSNKLVKIISFLFIIIFYITFSYAEDEPADIWKKNKKNTEQNNQINEDEDVTIESPILSGDIKKITINIDEQELDKSNLSIVGLFDPEENNFSLDMWIDSDGQDVKKIFKKLDKLRLSKFSDDLLFKVLFTNAYPPKNNLTAEEFLDIKINWLIKKKRFRDLENLLRINPQVGKETKANKSLINEYLSAADIKSACEKISFINKEVQSNYLDQFIIYCLIKDNRKDEAQLNLDLLKERGFKDKFFEDKINFLLGITAKTDQKIVDNNLLNFYISHITSDNFDYQPDENTDKYIWRYLSSSNLVQINDLENEEVVSTYERAAAESSFESEEIFNIYKQIIFNVNQLINANEVYKSLPNYKARALIYQSILLTDNVEKKLNLAFLLKELFIKDKLFDVYSLELSNILKSIDADAIPEDYIDIVKKNLEQNYGVEKKVKFDNEIIHRSKILKHFLENNQNITKTEKDFKNIYKKIKRNKKYFISIKDIIVLESLEVDGVKLPKDLDYSQLSAELTVPENLENLASKNQLGLVMLKIIEIIGEDKITDLDPDTIYFINRILNQLNLKKIRNNILSAALPLRA